GARPAGRYDLYRPEFLLDAAEQCARGLRQAGTRCIGSVAGAEGTVLRAAAPGVRRCRDGRAGLLPSQIRAVDPATRRGMVHRAPPQLAFARDGDAAAARLEPADHRGLG